MYSDPRVKERVKDLYDREKELLAVLRSIEETPITVVLGPRRVGKSSIIKTALNILAGKEKFKEYKPKHKYIPIYVDARKLVEEGSFSIYTFKKICLLYTSPSPRD